MNGLWQDIRYGLRMMGKNPGFTAIAVLTLALGIGANTAMSSLLNQIMLRRLPVRNPQELVILHDPGPKTGSVHSDGDETEPFTFPMYQGLRPSKSGFSRILGRFGFSASIASRGQTERGSGELVTGNYFESLGPRPKLGRVFRSDDDRVAGGHPVVVLSQAFWMRRFGGDPGVLNQALLVNNTELTIVGVARAGFSGIQLGQSPDVFVPMTVTAKFAPHRGNLDEWTKIYFRNGWWQGFPRASAAWRRYLQLGIYGVLTYLVVQRIREIGIRMALGAEADNVRWLSVKEVASMVFAGTAVGWPLAYGLARLSESILFGVHAGSRCLRAGARLDRGRRAGGMLHSRAPCHAVDALVALRYE